MKYFMTVVTVMFCIFISSRVNALGDINRVENLDGDKIEEATWNQQLYIVGRGFEDREGKHIVMDCTIPPDVCTISPCSFFIDLAIVEWRTNRIKAQIPQITSNAYRGGLLDMHEDAEAFPDALKTYIKSNAITGKIKIFEENVIFSNDDVTLTVTPALAIGIYRAPLVGRPVAKPPEFEAKIDQPVYTMQPDEPEVAIAPSSQSLEATFPSGQPKVTAMPPTLEFMYMPYNRCEALKTPISSGFSLPSFCYFRSARVDSIKPVYGPPGTYIEIKGSCLGSIGEGKSAWMNMPVGSLEMEIVSWSNNRIVARVPAADPLVTTGTGGYTWSADASYEKSTDVVESTIETWIDETRLTPQAFSLTPYEPDVRPILCKLNRESTNPGSWIVIYGSEFGTGDTPGSVYYVKDGVEREIREIVWSSSAIAVHLPRHMEDGQYDLYISRPNARGSMFQSNRLRLTVPALMIMHPPPR